ncbi:lipopolysaccharide biosynthesis protein [Methanosarcina sp.]|uniref:lipopolysaccharide biosynthesis protein n=1 Tax=Methanosarcina sp. TaxID=2213 RepID=UPI003C732B97
MSNFISNVLKLVSGSVTSQILGILLVPLITRIYSPDDLGVFQLFVSVSGILVIFSTFSYQFAIMLPKTEEDSANVVFLCSILVTLISLLTAVAVMIFPQGIEDILNAPGISKYLIYLPVIVFFNGLFFVQNYWLSRKVRFGIIAGSRILNTLSTKIFQLAAPIWSVSPLGLIAGYTVGYGFADLFMLKGAKEDLRVFRKVSVKKIKEVAIQYKSFPLFSSWSTLANTISPQVPTFLLAYFYSTSVVGYFSLANQVVNMPMGLIGTAIQQVFFQRISEVKNGNENGDMKIIVGEVYKKLILIGIFPMILLLILGEEIFTFAFGEGWHVSGIYVKILVPWIFLVFLSSPISTLYSVFEKQKVWLTFSMILLVSRVVALAIGGMYGSPEFALGLFSFTGVIFWLWNNAYLLNLAGINKMESVEILIKYAAIGIAVSIPLILLEILSANFYIILLAAVIITPIYYGLTLRDDPTFRKIFSAFLVSVRNKT